MNAKVVSRDLPEDVFLQQRLATLGKVMFIVTMLGISIRATIDVFSLGPACLLQPDYLWNLAGNATFGVLWAACAGKQRPRSFIAVLEAVVLLVACTSYAIMGIYYRQAALADYPGGGAGVLAFSHQYFSVIVLLTLTYAMAIRAAVVPSSAGRTRWLTGLVGVPLVVIATHGYTPAPRRTPSSGMRSRASSGGRSRSSSAG